MLYCLFFVSFSSLLFTTEHGSFCRLVVSPKAIIPENLVDEFAKVYGIISRITR
jgi:hypothetical protein